MPKPNKGEAKQDYLKRCTGELVDQEGQSADQAYAMCNAYWDDAHSQRAALSLTAPVALAAGPEELGDPEAPAAGFLITAYTGQVIDRGWWGKLVIDVGGIKTKAKLPVLREHARDRVVGFGTKTWKENANLFIRGDFSAKTKDAQEVRDLAGEGFPWEASIGVWPKKVKVLDSDKEEMEINGQKLAGPLEIWTESEVREVSFVALGADDGTAAIDFAAGDRVKVQIERGQTPQHKEGQIMPTTLVQLEADAPELLKEIRDIAREEGRKLGRDEGEQAERARVLEILGADGDREVSRQAIEAGTLAADTFKLLFAAEKAKRAQALTDLETSAPGSLGQTPPEKPEKADQRPPDVVLAEKAQARAKEKNIDLAAAQSEIWQEFPELARAYDAQYVPPAGH